jgi:hypothetical protein
MFSNKFNIGVLKHPGYNVGGGIGEAALIGAAFGGAKSLATGDDVLEGALLGGITGGAMSGITGAVMGKAATAAAGTGAGAVAKDAVTGQVLASSVPGTTGAGAFTNAINSGATLADDVALTVAQPSIAANAGLTGLPITNAGGMANVGLYQGAGLKATEQAAQQQAMANTGQAALSSGVSSQTPQGLAALNAATPPADRNSFEMFRDYVDAKPGSTTAKALNFAADNPEITAAGLGGTYGLMQPRKIPKLEEEEESPLAGYDPDNFTPYIPQTPNPYYSAKYAAEGGTMQSYAQGGITALAQGGMGGNMAYPQGRLDTTQYAMPSQMPTSALAVNSDYEVPTEPYAGSPLKMAEGGVARYAFGGSAGAGSQVYYDPDKGMYYTQGGNPMAGFASGNPMMAMNGMASAFGGKENRQYIGANGRPVEGGMGGKMGESMLAPNFQPSEAKPEVYQQVQQAQQAQQMPMTDFNPNSAAVAAQSVASPSYDAMMEGVAPQDFNRVFSQVMSQTPYAPPAPKPGEVEKKAQGGIAGYSLGGYAAGGNPRLLKGPGDGMSDNIPATIGGRQPARLADGEFVVPADVVSHLGNGSTDAGAKHLYKMMDKVRTARTGKKAQGKQIKPEKFIPR